MRNYILAVLQNASDGQDIKKHKFSGANEAVAWLRQNCRPAQINGTLFEINGQYDYSVGFVEFSSNGEPITKSTDNESVLLDKANFWKD